MNTWISLIIFILQLSYTIAVWDPQSPLVQIDKLLHEKRFPITVRESSKHITVYYSTWDADAITYFMCPDPNTEHPKGRFCNFGGSFAKSKYMRGERPIQRCAAPVRPLLLPDMIENGEGGLTHQGCSYGGYRYQFVYLRCKKDDYDYLDTTYVYNACYQETFKQMVYGSFYIENPSLLTNSRLIQEQAYTFEFDTFNYYYDDIDHFDEVSTLYTDTSPYIQRMILPPELLPFALQRKPLFHYMNIAPMDKDVYGIWLAQMDHLKTQVAKMREVVNVLAGVLDCMKYEDGTKVHLGEINNSPEIEIPIYWWVLIYNRNKSKGVVVMMNNMPDNSFVYNTENCSQLICSNANVMVHQNYPIYCCNPSVITEEHNLAGDDMILKFPRR